MKYCCEITRDAALCLFLSVVRCVILLLTLKPVFASLSSEVMADFDTVLKFWGPVEADYSAHGGMVLTRLVTPRTAEHQPAGSQLSRCIFSSSLLVYSQRIQKLNSSSPSLLALRRATWQVTLPCRPTAPRC